MTRPSTYRFLLLIVLALLVRVLPLHGEADQLQVARSFIGVTESGGNNRGPEVKMFLASVGLGQGHAWCAAFVSYCLTKASVTYPTKRTAGARNFISTRSIKARDVLSGRVTPESGWLVIWQHGNSWAGHIGFVVDWKKGVGQTIEGNTSSGKGSQRDGDGVYARNRSIAPGNTFRITHFEPVEEKPKPVATPVKPITVKDMGGSLPMSITMERVIW